MMSSVRYVVPCLRDRSPNPRPAEIAVPSHRGFFFSLPLTLTHTYTHTLWKGLRPGCFPLAPVQSRHEEDVVTALELVRLLAL